MVFAPFQDDAIWEAQSDFCWVTYFSSLWRTIKLFLCGQGRAAQLEAQLREKEQEIVRLRIALEATSIKAEDDTVCSISLCVPSTEGSPLARSPGLAPTCVPVPYFVCVISTDWSRKISVQIPTNTSHISDSRNPKLSPLLEAGESAWPLNHSIAGYLSRMQTCKGNSLQNVIQTCQWRSQNLGTEILAGVS